RPRCRPTLLRRDSGAALLARALSGSGAALAVGGSGALAADLGTAGAYRSLVESARSRARRSRARAHLPVGRACPFPAARERRSCRRLAPSTLRDAGPGNDAAVLRG